MSTESGLAGVCVCVCAPVSARTNMCILVGAYRQRADYNNKELALGSDVAAFHFNTAWAR